MESSGGLLCGIEAALLVGPIFQLFGVRGDLPCSSTPQHAFGAGVRSGAAWGLYRESPARAGTGSCRAPLLWAQLERCVERAAGTQVQPSQQQWHRPGSATPSLCTCHKAPRGGPVPPSGRQLPESVAPLPSHRRGHPSWRRCHLGPSLLTLNEKDPLKIPRKRAPQLVPLLWQLPLCSVVRCHSPRAGARLG